MKDKAMVVPGSVPKGNVGVLRAFALGYPGAHEEFPWGERVAKVKGKVFVFLGRDEGVGIAVKLPQSRTMALGLPFASPTAYGLGKSGWVSVQFAAGEKPPMDLLRAWIDESYRAVAPKTLVKELDGKGAAPAAKKKTMQRKTTAKQRKTRGASKKKVVRRK